jgi:hypothetical protein
VTFCNLELTSRNSISYTITAALHGKGEGGNTFVRKEKNPRGAIDGPVDTGATTV